MPEVPAMSLSVSVHFPLDVQTNVLNLVFFGLIGFFFATIPRVRRPVPGSLENPIIVGLIA